MEGARWAADILGRAGDRPAGWAAVLDALQTRHNAIVEAVEIDPSVRIEAAERPSRFPHPIRDIANGPTGHPRPMAYPLLRYPQFAVHPVYHASFLRADIDV